MHSPLVRLARRRTLGAVLALAAVLAATLGAAGAVPAARAMGPLPACRYDDILTAPRRYADWSTTLVDTILRVPSAYAPPDLVSTAQAGLSASFQVREVAVEDLKAMADAAKANGAPIGIQSAYRSYVQQKATFDHWVSVDGYKGALKVSARPGHSEHQLGLAIDFKSAAGGAPWDGGDWALSPAGAWMKAHAWEYGWVLSYPKNEYATVCYSYEPWHYRYVGRDLAALIHESGLTVREYLWANFTTAVVPPPSAGSSGHPAPGGTPAASPSATIEPSPSPAASDIPATPRLDPTASPAPAPTDTPVPAPSARPASSGDTFGNAGPAVIATVVVALVALVAGWWFVGRAAREGRGPG